MRFDILTLFPDMFGGIFNESIIARARENNILEINTCNIRDYSKDKHKKADDYPYGGGKGMLMMAQPIYDACMAVMEGLDYKPKVVYLSPQGRLLKQENVIEFAEEKHLILICGHYEGVDERVIEEIVDYEVSVGDYVLTGGEIPAMLLIDAVSRLLPGVLPSEEAFIEESHFNGLLEYPQYTRPYEFMGRIVPDVLMSGHHANIRKWRKSQSLKRTYLRRPDMFKNYELSREERSLLEEAGLGTESGD